MIRTSRQLKAFVRNLSKGNSTQAQIIIRNYIMERFLERISLSEYRKNFILKGGMLVSAMVGLDTRSTMDIDATIKNLPLTMETAQDIIEKIISVPIDDGVLFTIKNVASILEEAEYGGIRAALEAKIDTMRTPLQVDISTGDVITPQEVAYEFKLMFEERTISIWAYNLESVLAEKLETVLSRGTANTRLRDFYDLYVLKNDNSRTIDMTVFPKAFEATCSRRQSMPIVSDGHRILSEIKDSKIMMQLWHNYQKKYSYAESITWDDVMDAILKLFIATRQVK